MADPPPGAPASSIVLLGPDPTSWLAAAGDGKRFFGKWLSECIVITDNGPFSHVALRNEDEVVDARRATPAVNRSWLASLLGLGRPVSFSKYEHGSLQPVWNRIVEDLSLPPPGASGPAGVDDENGFSMLGLLQIAIALVTSESRWLRPLGRWLLRRHRDDPGFFCSELLAKGAVDAGREILVDVPPARIPPAGSADERELVEMLVARAAINAATVAAETADLRETFRGQLSEVSDGVGASEAASATNLVRVGYPGSGGGPTLPPSLVTPNDLFRSPSFQFVVRGDGNTTPPQLTPVDRAARGRAFVLASLFLSPVAAVTRLVRR